MRRYAAISPDRLPGALTELLVAVNVEARAVRVALDGPRAAAADELADALVEPLRAHGRPAIHVRAQDFWRDASLRLEYGRTDVEAFRDWLDDGALRREVLDPLGPDAAGDANDASCPNDVSGPNDASGPGNAGGTGEYLPSLRDPVTNRATREPRRAAAPGSVLIVSGELLLGRGLPFDVTIHLAMSAAARARRTPAPWAWTLPAFDRYDRDVDPIATADVVIRCDDPHHPAISGPSTGPSTGR